MGVITAPFTATERRNLQLQIHNYPFDAIPVYDAPLSSTLRRRARRDKSFVSRRDHNSGGTQDNPLPLPPPPLPPPKDMDNNDNGNSGSGGEGAMCINTFTINNGETVTTTRYHSQHCKPVQTAVTSNFNGIAGASSTGSTSSLPTYVTSAPDETSSSITDSGGSEEAGGSSATVTKTTALSSSPETPSQAFSPAPPPSIFVSTSPSNTGAADNSSPPTTHVQSTSKAGPIAGGVIGGLVLIFLFILGTILFLHRRRRKRTPASAEFRDRYIPRSHVVTPLAMQGSSEYLDNRDSPDAPPPPFTQGDYSDPLFEKIAETRQAHMQYGFTR